MKKCLFIISLVLSTAVMAQKPNALIRSGNTAYQQGAFDDAEVAYSNALRADGALDKAHFNLGDALYRQERMEDALAEFNAAAELSNDPNIKAKSYHNMGNILGAGGQWDQAVEAYKNALRNNPNDSETRHNLAYAQKQLKEQQQQEQEKDKNQDQQNEDQQNEDQEDQEQNQDEQDPQDQENQDQQNQEDQQKDQQQKDESAQDGEDDQEQQPDEQQGKNPAEGQISREEAMRLLEALQQQEQQVQDKLKKEKVKAKKVKKEKDW